MRKPSGRLVPSPRGGVETTVITAVVFPPDEGGVGVDTSGVVVVVVTSGSSCPLRRFLLRSAGALGRISRISTSPSSGTGMGDEAATLIAAAVAVAVAVVLVGEEGAPTLYALMGLVVRRVVRGQEVIILAPPPFTGEVLLLVEDATCLAEAVADDSTVLLDDVDVLGVRSLTPPPPPPPEVVVAAEAGGAPPEVEDRRGILPLLFALAWDVVEVFEMVETGLPPPPPTLAPEVVVPSF